MCGVFTLGDCSRYRSRECARVFARPVARPLAHRLLDLEELWSRFTGESSPPAPPIAVESPEFVPSPRTGTSTRAEVAQKSRKITARSVAQISPNTRHHFARPSATVHEYGRPCTTVDDLTAMLQRAILRWNGREEHDYSDDCQRLVDDGVRTYHERSGDGCDRHSDQHDRSRDYAISTSVAPATITIDLASPGRSRTIENDLRTIMNEHVR